MSNTKSYAVYFGDLELTPNNGTIDRFLIKPAFGHSKVKKIWFDVLILESTTSSDEEIVPLNQNNDVMVKVSLSNSEFLVNAGVEFVFSSNAGSVSNTGKAIELLTPGKDYSFDGIKIQSPLNMQLQCFNFSSLLEYKVSVQIYIEVEEEVFV